MVRPRTVVKAHKAIYDNPVVLARGEVFTLTGRSDNWHGHTWLWAAAADGREGWVPDDLAVRKNGRTIAGDDYSAVELDVAPGAQIMVGKSRNGWVWCRAGNGDEGWVPLECLGPL